MPFYRPLARYAKSHYPFDRPIDPAARVRTAEGLLRLRDQFEREVPGRTLNDTLLLATWNIREFDAGTKSDRRLPESYYYIAEILSHFDLIAVQEVREDLAPLDRVISILGPWWKYIVTDVTYGRKGGGNGERMAFIHDTRKVAFAGLAGEVVLPEEKTAKGSRQLARTPFLCGFKAHWSRFNLCTVHLYYGESKPDDPRRVQEVVDLAGLLQQYVAGPPSEQPGKPKTRENLILLGDFNIFTRKDKQMKALNDAGFQVPPELIKLPGSNLDRSKFYDQIAFQVSPDRFETTGRAGVFDFYQSVFRDQDEASSAALMSPDRAAGYKAGKRGYSYRDWKSFQMSDHLVLWVELRIDFGHEYLLEAAGRKPVPKAVAGDEAAEDGAGSKAKRRRTLQGSKRTGGKSRR